MFHIKQATSLIFHLNYYLPLFVDQYGVWIYMLLFSVIFCETGIVFMAVLPGDSLLFAAGSIAAVGKLDIFLLILILFAAAFLGNMLNYFVGNRVGHLLFKNETSLFFKKSYINKTHAFYEKYGGKTIVLALFVPIVRTFAPFIAGAGQMRFVKFVFYDFFGAFFWVALILSASYCFGNIPVIKRNFSFIILAIIIVSVLPPIVEFVRTRFSKRFPGQ